MNTRKAVFHFSMSVLALAIATELHAQAPESRALEEILVTAQKRAETAQEVPVAIDVVTGDAFIREGVRDVKDFTKMSTDLQINFNYGQVAVIGVRGLRQQPTGQPNDPLAAMHLDGAYIASVYGYNGLMFDLERVEFLSGPQGTLYGRNAVAGAINLITKRPGDTFEANGMVEYGSENTVRLNGGVTMPMGEALSVRLAAQKFTRDALFNDGASEQDQWSSRLSVLWKLSDADEIFATADYGDFGGTNEATTLLGLNRDARTAGGAVPASVTNYLNSPTLNDPYNVLPYTTQQGLVFWGNNEQTNWGAMAQYTHDFGGFSSVLQYSHRDVDGLSRAHTRGVSTPSGSLLPHQQESNTAELRFLSDSGGSLEWVGGLFYADSATRGWASFQYSTIINPGPDPVTGKNIPPCPCQAGFYPNYYESWAYAAYGQGTWTPESMEALHITVGARYSKDWKKGYLGYFVANVPVFVYGVAGMSPGVQALFAPYLANGSLTDLSGGDNRRDWDNVQWKVGAEYELTDASMVYASIGTGYKAGGMSNGPTPEVQPEDLLAYEIGTKNQFLGNTLQVNASAWFYDYTDFEAGTQRNLITPVPLPDGTFLTGIDSTTNVKKAKLAGVSSDIDWLATDNDQLGLSFTWTFSEVTDGSESVPNCVPVLTCSLLVPGSSAPIFNEGERLGDAPKWQVMGRYSHIFNFADGATLNPALKYRWESEKWDRSTRQDTRFYPDAKLDRLSIIPSQDSLDVSLKYTAASTTWDVMAYANNVTDELYIKTLSYGANPADANYGHINGTIGEPRTYGVILSARFR